MLVVMMELKPNLLISRFERLLISLQLLILFLQRMMLSFQHLRKPLVIFLFIHHSSIGFFRQRSRLFIILLHLA